MSQRDDDIKLLRAAIGKVADSDDPVDYSTAEAFERMLSDLTEGRWYNLTEKQRAWAADVADQPLYVNLHSSGKVPDGLGLSRVKTPEVLKNLPKKPPRRS
jgi:hypothetical protein